MSCDDRSDVPPKSESKRVKRCVAGLRSSWIATSDAQRITSAFSWPKCSFRTDVLRRCKLPADCISASPCFVDITYTRRYIWWFLRERVFIGNACSAFSGTRGCSSVGRALEWHSRGQGFDSPRLHWAGGGAAYVCAPGRNRGNSSVGRAQPCQGWGRGFESRFPLCVGRLAQLVRAPR